MKERDLAALRFQAAARDLEQIVRSIAARYIVQGVPLTWRLLHAIEAEALADLGFASRHEGFVADLFRRPDDISYPQTDEVATFGQSNALPAAFGFAVSAYEEAQRQSVETTAGSVRKRERSAPEKPHLTEATHRIDGRNGESATAVLPNRPYS